MKYHHDNQLLYLATSFTSYHVARWSRWFRGVLMSCDSPQWHTAGRHKDHYSINRKTARFRGTILTNPLIFGWIQFGWWWWVMAATNYFQLRTQLKSTHYQSAECLDHVPPILTEGPRSERGKVTSVCVSIEPPETAFTVQACECVWPQAVYLRKTVVSNILTCLKLHGMLITAMIKPLETESKITVVPKFPSWRS